jgi:hypothetical protein
MAYHNIVVDQDLELELNLPDTPYGMGYLHDA